MITHDSPKGIDCFLILFYKNTLLENIRKHRNGVIYIYAFLQAGIEKKKKYSEMIKSPRSTEMRHTRNENGCLSPSKARHQLALVIQIFLNLLPHVKDGTIPAAEEAGGTVLAYIQDCHCVLSHNHSAANTQS